jgi:hypothetical protein
LQLKMERGGYLTSLVITAQKRRKSTCVAGYSRNRNCYRRSACGLGLPALDLSRMLGEIGAEVTQMTAAVNFNKFQRRRVE